MKTYRETMDELRFTEQEKEAMVDRLLERGGSRRKGLNLRCAAVAVAAAAVLTVGAGAAVVLTPAGEVFASVLGGAPAQTEILDWMGVPVGASDTHNGVTITADASLGTRTAMRLSTPSPEWSRIQSASYILPPDSQTPDPHIFPHLPAP